MATVEQVLEVLEATTRISQSHLVRVARALREVSSDPETARMVLETAGCGNFWPHSGRGRSKPRHVEVHHLSSIAIAAAVGRPMAIGAYRVAGFRRLTMVKGNCPGATFGEAIDGLIDAASRAGATRDWLESESFIGQLVTLSPNMWPSAKIQYWDGSQEISGHYEASGKDRDLIVGLMGIHTVGISYIALIDARTVLTLGNLLADSWAAAEPALIPEHESGASPARETPPSTRPSEGVTPPAEDRSLSTSDPIPRVCVSAMPDGGSPPTTAGAVQHEHAYEIVG